MANVLLVVLLIIALALIGVVLMQRSEGGGLGMGGGGGGGGGGMMSGRSAATALSKVTWALGAAFFAVSIALTVIAASETESGSVLDGVGADASIERPGLSEELQGDLLPPSLGGDDDLIPPPAAD